MGPVGEEICMAVATIERIPATAPIEFVRGRGGGGPAPKRIVVAYGFWIFILSDMVMFSALFAAFAVLRDNNAGGPSAIELFNIRNVFIETLCLLLSSYTCGLGLVSAGRGQLTVFLICAIFTFALGAAFLFIEATEFAGMVASGAGPWRSAFLSSFFTLVGTHGVHVASGLIALVYLVAQVLVKGLSAAVLRRLLCWSLFWHALDIVWVGVFTLVYLMGDHLR
jgi:cytochrome o ubiquinol oxidase subunit III